MVISTAVNNVKVDATGRGVNGLETPIMGRTRCIKSPVNKEKAILNPIVYKRVSVMLILCIFRILRIINPGTKVRKVKPTTCLKPGMERFAETIISTASAIDIVTKTKLLIFQSFGIVIA